jgi:hypothetical protein
MLSGNLFFKIVTIKENQNKVYGTYMVGNVDPACIMVAGTGT